MRLALAVMFLALAGPAFAQDRASHCIAIADTAPGIEYLHRASWRDDLPGAYSVRITYVDHSMFLIQTPDATAVTDYHGGLGAPDFAPDIVTMNNAHSTHWTHSPDPRIPHVLRGWPVAGEAARHRLEVGELFVRNVTTDIRGRMGGARRDGNSIFVFETSGLCIGHLGHLHHEPDAAQYAALGRLDVVMAAVDGGLTLDLPNMVRVLERLRASVVIPMHWFGAASLDRFLADISDSFAVDLRDASSLDVSLRTLPEVPTVIVLRPAFLQ